MIHISMKLNFFDLFHIFYLKTTNKMMQLIYLYVEHYRLITDQLDVIKNVNIEWLNNMKLDYPIINRFHYLIILLTINYFTIDSISIIYLHCVIETKCTNLINSTRLIPHRLFPQTFWYQGDVISIIALVVANANFIILLFIKSLCVFTIVYLCY